MPKYVKIFSDGAARGNPDGPGGYGAILQYTDANGVLHEKELSEGFEKTTNNRMELLGVITALECLRVPCIVDVLDGRRPRSSPSRTGSSGSASSRPWSRIQ